MSFGARLVIAIFSAFFGIVMAAIAPPGVTGAFFYAFAAFCIAISLACLSRGRFAQFFGSVVASGVLIAGAMYLVAMLLNGEFFSAKRSDQSVVNALRFLGVFGLPSAVYLWKTRFSFGASKKQDDVRLAVEIDERGVRVRELKNLESPWNQSFQWPEVKRVCFKDEGLFASDILIIYLNNRDQPVIVPTEAEGGSELLGALTKRGLFPEEVWRKAIGETNGGMHCWPPAGSR